MRFRALAGPGLASLATYVGISLFNVYAVSLYLNGQLTLYIHPRYILFTVALNAASLLACCVGFVVTSWRVANGTITGGIALRPSLALLVAGLVLAAAYALPASTLSSSTAAQRADNLNGVQAPSPRTGDTLSAFGAGDALALTPRLAIEDWVSAFGLEPDPDCSIRRTRRGTSSTSRGSWLPAVRSTPVLSACRYDPLAGRAGSRRTPGSASPVVSWRLAAACPSRSLSSRGASSLRSSRKTRMSSASASPGRAFYLAFALLVAVLLTGILVLAVLVSTSGPRVRQVDVRDPEGYGGVGVVGQGLTVFFDRPIETYDPGAAVEIRPETDHTVTQRGQQIDVSFDQNLLSNTEYVLTIGPGLTDATGRRMERAYTYEFGTEKPVFTYLKRDYGPGKPDRVVERSPLSGESRTLIEADRITRFARNDEYLAVVLSRPEEGDELRGGQSAQRSAGRPGRGRAVLPNRRPARLRRPGRIPARQRIPSEVRRTISLRRRRRAAEDRAYSRRRGRRRERALLSRWPSPASTGRRAGRTS